MVRGIADLASVPVAERIGSVWIFPVDIVDMTDVPIDPRDVAAARMALLVVRIEHCNVSIGE